MSERKPISAATLSGFMLLAAATESWSAKRKEAPQDTVTAARYRSAANEKRERRRKRNQQRWFGGEVIEVDFELSSMIDGGVRLNFREADLYRIDDTYSVDRVFIPRVIGLLWLLGLHDPPVRYSELDGSLS